MKVHLHSIPRMVLLAASVGLVAPVAGQHQGHPMPGQPDPAQPADQQAAAACLEGSRQALEIVARANARLDAARQTNNPPAMRAAMDDLQAALSEIKTRLASCEKAAVTMLQAGPHAGHQAPGTPVTQPAAAQPAPAAPMDHSKMGHAMPAPQQQPVDHSKMDHSKMGHGAAPADVTDPVCGMKVTEQRHKAEYKGQTYYFCSEADRQKFVASPQKYLRVAQPPK
jgi:YHS domain-containing protein